MISKSFIYKRTLTQSVIYFPYGFWGSIYIRIVGDSKITMLLREISSLTLQIVNHSRLNSIKRDSDIKNINTDSILSSGVIGNSTVQVI